MSSRQDYLTAEIALMVGKRLSSLTLDHFKKVYDASPI